MGPHFAGGAQTLSGHRARREQGGQADGAILFIAVRSSRVFSRMEATFRIGHAVRHTSRVGTVYIGLAKICLTVARHQNTWTRSIHKQYLKVPSNAEDNYSEPGL